MKHNLSKIALMASITLAIALAFSCSSDSNDSVGDPSLPSVGDNQSSSSRVSSSSRTSSSSDGSSSSNPVGSSSSGTLSSSGVSSSTVSSSSSLRFSSSSVASSSSLVSSSSSNPSSSSVVSSSSVTTYTITYDANSGTGAPATQTKNYGVSLTLSSTKPTKTSYTFTIWNTKPDGSGDDYFAGGSYTKNADITLYAQWAQTGTINGPLVSYGGETYQTVVIGTQTWFKRNLNYDVSGSKCYGEGGKVENSEGTGYVWLSNSEIQANCVTYGRLYNWVTAMALPSSCQSSSCASQISTKHKGICPSGWHIPSDSDWNVLMKFVNPNCSDNKECRGAGTRLKATSGWNYGGVSGNGTDDYGFSALPGGSYGSSDVPFLTVGYRGYWWSTSENGSGNAYSRYMTYYYEDAYWLNSVKTILYSVRCLQD